MSDMSGRIEASDSGNVSERDLREEPRYVSEADRLPIAQGMYVVVGEPFERVVGSVAHSDMEEFELSQDRIRLTVVAYDETEGDGVAASYSFTSHRWQADHLPKVTRDELELLQNLGGHELFLQMKKLYAKSSIQLLYPFGGSGDYRRFVKLQQLIGTPGRFERNKETVQSNMRELEEMIEEIVFRRNRARVAKSDDGIEF